MEEEEVEVFIRYYMARYSILPDSYCPNLFRIWLVAAPEIGDQDVEIISQSFLIFASLRAGCS